MILVIEIYRMCKDRSCYIMKQTCNCLSKIMCKMINN